MQMLKYNTTKHMQISNLSTRKKDNKMTSSYF